MVDIPQALIEKLAKRQVVLFVGAGLSMGAGLPSWKSLLNTLYDYVLRHKLGNEATYQGIQGRIEGNSLLAAADKLYEQLDEEHFDKVMREIILDGDIRPQATHRLISQLNFYRILTTNYDTLIESAFEGAKIPVYTQNDYAALKSTLENSDDFCIVKCHGDINDASSIILTHKHYEDLIRQNDAYNQFLSALFNTKTMLFVGYSLNDPDLDLILENSNYAFGGAGSPHYALIWRGPEDNRVPDWKIEDTLDQKKIKTLLYNDHSDVETFLQKLLDGMPKEKVVEATTPAEIWRGSPFPGLRSFTEEDAPIYFGRAPEVAQLLGGIQQNPMMIVVGASGSGKSSLVRAGMIPQLRENLPQGESLQVVRVVPGTTPLENLRTGLSTIEGINLDTAMPRGNPHASLKAISKQLDASNRQKTVLLFIDQFEEIFTLTESESERETFINLLRGATMRVRVVITMRADFYHEASVYAIKEELMTQNMTLSRPSTEQLRTMIANPGKLANLTFEAGLLDRILSDIGREPGNLALMAYLLDELYKVNASQGVDADTTKLTIAEYENLGGVQGVIEKRAESIFQGFAVEGLDNDEASAISIQDYKMAWLGRVFRELLTVDERGVATRQRAYLSQFAEQDRQWITAFSDARLLVMGSDQTAGGQDYVEVAHEALLREWDRLVTWIDARRVDFHIERRMLQNYEHWLNNNKQNKDLPTAEKLVEYYMAMANLGKPLVSEKDLETLTEDEKEFLVFTQPEHERHLETLRFEAISFLRYQYLIFRLQQLGVPPITIYATAINNLEASGDVKADAARQLGKIADPDVVEPLISAMPYIYTEESLSAGIWALGETGDSRAAEVLAYKVREWYFSPEIQQKAIEALGKLGDDAIPYLKDLKDAIDDEALKRDIEAEIAAINNPGTADVARYHKKMNLKTGLFTGWRKDLEKAFDYVTDIAERAKIPYLLATLNNEKSTKTLEKVLGDKKEDLLVRIEAARALATFETSKIPAALEKVLKNEQEDLYLLDAVASTLHAIGTPEAKKILKNFLNNNPQIIPPSAIAGFSNSDDEEIIPIMERLNSEEYSSDVSDLANIVLCQVGHMPAIEGQIKIITSEEFAGLEYDQMNKRHNAMSVLKDIPDSSLNPHFQHVLYNDSWGTMRALAMEGLVKLDDPDLRSHVTYVIENDPSIEVRTEVVLACIHLDELDLVMNMWQWAEQRDMKDFDIPALIAVREIATYDLVNYVMHYSHSPDIEIRALAVIGAYHLATKFGLPLPEYNNVSTIRRIIEMVEKPETMNPYSKRYSGIERARATVKQLQHPLAQITANWWQEGYQED